MKLKSLIVAAAAFLFSVPAFAAQMNVPMNEMGVLPLEGSPATVVVGNPMIADVAVVEGNTLVVHGRIFGNTEVIVLDAAGQVLTSVSVSVTDTWRGGLALHRGNPDPGMDYVAESVNYVCNPVCVRALHPGDASGEAEDFASQGGRWQDLTQRGMMLGDEAQQ